MTRTAIEAAELDLEKQAPRDMPTDGEARLDPPRIEVPDGPVLDKTHTEMLAFMEERCIVNIADSNDPRAENPVPLGVNGRMVYVLRNQDTIVARKYVECLARAKKTTYRQEHYKDGNGDDAIRNMPHTALQYPFTVIRDDNPKGGAWLRKVLAEG